MSHSQFHSTNVFILRHAWLNLWDKHMTTGRINQVTTLAQARIPAAYYYKTQVPVMRYKMSHNKAATTSVYRDFHLCKWT